MNALEEWAGAAGEVLGIDAMSTVEQRTVLNVAREVAHKVLRPGAPVTTFLLGVAVGRGADLDASAAALIDLATRFAKAPDES
jgi:hypothetical protein